MTTIITRVYSDKAAAEAVAATLQENKIPASAIDVISGNRTLAAKMEAAQVSGDEAAVYTDLVKGGNALLVVRAGFNPIGAAKKAMEVVDAAGPIETEVANNNRYLRSTMDRYDKSFYIQHGYWANWPIPLISHREPGVEMTVRHGFWGGFLMKHLSSRVPNKDTTIRHGFWGKFLMGHLSSRTPSIGSTIRRGYYGGFLMPHLVKASRNPNSKSDSRFPFSNALGLPMLVNR